MESSYLTAEQVTRLLAPVNPARIEDLRGMSYLAQHDVRAHMNRIFGFARWGTRVNEVLFLYDEEVPRTNGQGTAWKAGYRATVRVDIYSPDGTWLTAYEDSHASSCAPQPDRGEAHALALTTAVSTAFKRACTNLGDQFGLSLYESGQRTALVIDTLIKPEGTGTGTSTSSKVETTEPAEMSEEALDVFARINAIAGLGLEAGPRITEIAALKASVQSDVLSTWLPTYGASLGVLADRVAATGILG